MNIIGLKKEPTSPPKPINHSRGDKFLILWSSRDGSRVFRAFSKTTPIAQAIEAFRG